MANSVVLLAAESGAAEGVNPWFIGIGAFVLLLILLLAVVSFGGGREHS